MQVCKIGHLIMAALHLLTLLSLTTIILSLAENISIDCGASESYVDKNNVTWVGDKGFVITGEPMKIPDVVTKPINTLRYFPTGQTNCYNIPATRARKTLVRTRFYYGNYDGKSSPPSFNVVYDEKHYVPVSPLNDVYQSVFISEVIFAPASEDFSVCVNRTSSSDDPFISSIEVYGLDAGMYDDLGAHGGLILRQRFAFGAKEIISYPSDPYGRRWLPVTSNHTKISKLTTSAPIDTSGVSNKPPEIVMSNALSSPDGLKLTLPLAGIRVYLALYFSEPHESLGGTQRRSFNVSLDNTQLGSGPIVPVYGNATQVVIKDIVATSPDVVFQSTEDSVLPPIINALELYSISNGQDGGGHGGESGGGGGGGGGGQIYGSYDYFNTDLEDLLRRGSKKKNKSPLIVGVTVAALLASAFAACFRKKCHNAKPVSSTTPITSTGFEKEISPLNGQQLASDASHPKPDEPDVYDIEESA